jgi:hypothetical protein
MMVDGGKLGVLGVLAGVEVWDKSGYMGFGRLFLVGKWDWISKNWEK